MTIDDGLRRAIWPVIDTIESEMQDSTAAMNVQVRLYADGETLPAAIGRPLSRPEGYAILIARTEVKIAARDTQGVVHALTTLEKLQRQWQALPAGRVLDWPDHRLRALHVVLQGSTVGTVQKLIRKAHQVHFSTLILEIGDAVRLSSMPWVAGGGSGRSESVGS